MGDTFNSGIAFFNNTKVQKGAINIRENIASQSNKQVKNEGNKIKTKVGEDAIPQTEPDVNPGNVSTGRLKRLNSGVAAFDDVTIEEGAIIIDKNIGHQENEFPLHPNDPSSVSEGS